MIIGHGDDRHSCGNPIQADFSSNVWFGGPSPDLIEHLKQNLAIIGNCPEPDSAGLCREIAAFYQINVTQVMAFNGSVEAFYCIAAAFRKSVSSILFPAFAEYEDACRMHRHIPSFYKTDELESVLKLGTNLIWIGNPNNPDGYVFRFSLIEKELKRYSNTIFVVDEAYADFIPNFQSVISLTNCYPNLIVVRSLTKCCAIPGLRLGYVVASENLICRLRKFMQPWSVNAMAQEAGIFLLKAGNRYRINAEEILSLSKELKNKINQIDGFHVFQSKTPYFIVELQTGTAAILKRFLIENHGLLIRDASNFRGLNERYFRVCTRDENDNRLLIDGLKNYSKKMYHLGNENCTENSK